MFTLELVTIICAFCEILVLILSNHIVNVVIMHAHVIILPDRGGGADLGEFDILKCLKSSPHHRDNHLCLKSPLLSVLGASNPGM